MVLTERPVGCGALEPGIRFMDPKHPDPKAKDQSCGEVIFDVQNLQQNICGFRTLGKYSISVNMRQNLSDYECS